jgi:hypothetical protein
VKFDFEAEIMRWPGNTAFFYCLLPVDAAREITEITQGLRGGFGSVRVDVRCGATQWRTSVFMDKKSSSYLMLLKKTVREAESLSEGQIAKFKLELVDF